MSASTPRTRRLVVDPSHPDAHAIAEAAAVLRGGGLVAFPTETVYGLGADARSRDAVAGIFAAKGRPHTDPLIVHLADGRQLSRVARAVPEPAQVLAARFWPGPLTIIVPRHPDVPPVVTAGLESVAVRVPAHPVARALLAAADVPVAAPSANRFTRPSPTTAAHVLADLDGRIDLVLDGGATLIGVESTIVDCTQSPPIVRRAGGLPVEALRAIVPDLVAADHATAEIAAPQLAPGQLLRHYAPRAPMTVYDGADEAVVATIARAVRDGCGRGARMGVLAPEAVLLGIAPAVAAAASAGRVVVETLGPSHAPDAAARVLYAALRRLDDAGVDAIVAAGPVRHAVGAAVWDRLRRAAEGRVVPV